MTYATCEKCNTVRNIDLAPECPLCKQAYRPARKVPKNKPKLKERGKNETPLRAYVSDRREYYRKYRKQHRAKINDYNREWMRNYRAKQKDNE